MANIYEKLQGMRVALHKTELKKSGKNTHTGYNYFELGDFLPTINTLMDECKVCGVVRFGIELATLTLYDSEQPESTIEFTSPMSTAALKGCHDVQNLGAVQTYLRRYLYTTAFEIVEYDALDALVGKDNPKQSTAQNTQSSRSYPESTTTPKPAAPLKSTNSPSSTEKATTFQITTINKLTDDEQFVALLTKYNVTRLEDISFAQAKTIIEKLKERGASA